MSEQTQSYKVVTHFVTLSLFHKCRPVILQHGSLFGNHGLPMVDQVWQP